MTVLRDEADIAQSQTGQLAAATSKARPFRLSWTHYVFLLGIKNPDERSFYEIESSDQNWNLRELRRQFDSGLYERLALSRDKEGVRRLAREGQIVSQPQDLLKEPLVLEFLGLSEQARYTESDLEGAIISQIERFLLELGKGFLFEARQKRFTFDGEHFFVDLVFYNRLLRCYVLIDLLCGRPHNKSSVAQALMWRRPERSAVPSIKAQAKRHISYRATDCEGTALVPHLASKACR